VHDHVLCWLQHVATSHSVHAVLCNMLSGYRCTTWPIPWRWVRLLHPSQGGVRTFAASPSDFSAAASTGSLIFGEDWAPAPAAPPLKIRPLLPPLLLLRASRQLLRRQLLRPRRLLRLIEAAAAALHAAALGHGIQPGRCARYQCQTTGVGMAQNNHTILHKASCDGLSEPTVSRAAATSTSHA
jgi:hypothetical protein